MSRLSFSILNSVGCAGIVEQEFHAYVSYCFMNSHDRKSIIKDFILHKMKSVDKTDLIVALGVLTRSMSTAVTCVIG